MMDDEAFDDELVFADEPVAVEERAQAPRDPVGWKVLVVDDDPQTHEATRLVLRGELLDARPIDLLSAYSAAEARDLISRTPDVALVIADVVLETAHAGLDLVRWIRLHCPNRMIRVALRTGAPEVAPEAEIMRDYEINDYWPKTEMTSSRLLMAIRGALRSYRDLHTMHSAEIPASTLGLGSEEPRRLGRYVVLERAGTGGMGIVYAAYDPQLDRKVAVKLMHAASVNKRAQQRLLREARAMARLSHPNVVAVYDVGIHEGRVFVAMDFIRGITLTQWLHAEARTCEQILEKFEMAGRGLAAAHEAGLVHRDFKPENVLVGRKRGVKVTDFGIAQAVEPSMPTGRYEAIPALSSFVEKFGLHLDDSADLGLIMGTPNYMAPEQHFGAEADARADQFSFSLALWEALYGEKPFKGEALTTRLAACHAGEFSDSPNKLRVPRRIRGILMRGLSWQAENRWPSMQALLAAIGTRSRVVVFARRLGIVVVAVAIVVSIAVGGLAFHRSSRNEMAAIAEAHFDLAQRYADIDSVKATENAREAILVYVRLGEDFHEERMEVIQWLSSYSGISHRSR